MPVRGGSRGCRRTRRPDHVPYARGTRRDVREVAPAPPWGWIRKPHRSQEVSEAERSRSPELGRSGRIRSLRTRSRDARAPRIAELPGGARRQILRGRPALRRKLLPIADRTSSPSWSRRVVSSALIAAGTSSSLSPAIVEHERHHLLDEKRIAFGGLDDTPTPSSSTASPSRLAIS